MVQIGTPVVGFYNYRPVAPSFFIPIYATLDIATLASLVVLLSGIRKKMGLVHAFRDHCAPRARSGGRAP
jgi:hypothetical protein